MSHTVLLYGATGFSGRLIAAEGRRIGMANRGGAPEPRMILAGRDGDALEELSEQCRMEYRVFGLDDRRDVRRGLRDVDVLVNAAGPFAWTAPRLVKDALDVGCQYVDINGEVDVYMKLDDLGRYASQRARAIVCSAGHTAAASDLLLAAALDELRADADLEWGSELGAVRIGMSCAMNLSRGSAETVWRSLREQVKVVRGTSLWHEPVGKLERTFDFRAHGHGDEPGERDVRVASAANLVDTLTARRTIARHGFSAKSIESYVEAGPVARIGYQLGTLLAAVATLRPVRFLARQQLGFLPPGPTDDELREERHIVLLDIEDPGRTRITDWRWETPNAYQFTAQVVVEIATQVAKGPFTGWLTPAAVLRRTKGELTADVGALRDCRLNDRLALRRKPS